MTKFLNQMMWSLAVTSVLICNIAFAEPARAELPVITIAECSAPPFLDGVLTDACWQTATLLTNFTVFQRAEENAGHKVYLTHDDQWLYLACEISHPAPEHIKQTVFMHDGAVHRDDSIEVFLDPGTDGAFYAHYILNAANIKADQVMLQGGKSDRETHMPWRSATRITDTGWNTEMALPWRCLTEYQQKFKADWAKVRLNVCVNMYEPVFDPYGARMDEHVIQATWVPVRTGFHDPDNFGRIAPLNIAGKSDPIFLPRIASAQPDGYITKGGQGYWTMTAKIKNAGDADGKIVLSVMDQPVSGAAVEEQTTSDVKAKAEQAIGLQVPIVTPGQRWAMARLHDPEHGGTWETWLLDESVMRVTDPFEAFLDRSYYTEEPEAYVRGKTILGDAARRDTRISARDVDGNLLGETRMTAATVDLPLTLDMFANGEHIIDVALGEKSTAPISTQRLILVKRPSNPAGEVKVDRFNGVVLKNNEPYFPFGLYVEGLDSQDDEYFQRIADAGFNLVLRQIRRNIPIDPLERRKFWRTAGHFGLDVIDWEVAAHPMPAGAAGVRRSYNLKVYEQKQFTLEEELDVAKSEFNDLLPALKAKWELTRVTPNYVAHYQVDEPNLGGNLRREVNMAVAEDFYRELTGMDPYHPALMIFACHIPAGRRWTDWADILAYDPYLYAGWGRFDYCAPNFMAFKVDELARRAKSARRAPWVVPLAESVDVGRMPRALKPEEQECQTWLALIHGAKGLVYFINTAIYTQSGWDVLRRLGERMKFIGPAIVAPAVPQTIDYAPVAMDAQRRQFPDVQTRLFRHPDGRFLLLAANSAAHPVKAEFTIADIKEPGAWSRLIGRGAVRDLFGKGAYPVNGRTFKDNLDGYAVRAYLIDNSQLASFDGNASNLRVPAPISIKVSCQAHPAAGAAQAALPISEIMRRKNKMPNPSFAIASIPGAPDYVRPLMYLTWPLVGDPAARWGLDTNNPWHGKQCLRIAHDWKGGEPPGPTHRITQAVCYVTPSAESRPYVLSFYARAASAGDELSVHVYGFENPASERWKLTAEWRRYVFAGVLTPSGTSIQAINFYTWSKDAVVWLDGMQMEAGNQASSFTEE